MEFWKSFADDTHGGSSIDQRDQSAFGATRQFVALAMLMFLASCGSKKQVYYADAAMNEQTITAKGKSKKKDQKKKDEGVVYSSDPTTRYIQQYAAIAQEEMRRYKIPASITLAQGLLESQLGQGVLAQKSTIILESNASAIGRERRYIMTTMLRASVFGRIKTPKSPIVIIRYFW